MDENTKKIIKEQFRTLPDSLKKVIDSGDIERILNTLTEGHPLENHQHIAIENEIMLVLLGLEDFSSFTTNIKHSAQISRERAERITKVINREIFIPNQAAINIKTVQKEINRPVSSDQTTNTDRKDGVMEKQENNSMSADTSQHTNPTENDMFHKKLKQQVHIPSGEEKITLKETTAEEKPKQDASATDPYREPLE